MPTLARIRSHSFRFNFERRKLARCRWISSLQSHKSTSPLISLEVPQEFESISFRKHWDVLIAMIACDFLSLSQKKYSTFSSIQYCRNLVITFIQFVVASGSICFVIYFYWFINRNDYKLVTTNIKKYFDFGYTYARVWSKFFIYFLLRVT